MALGDDLTTDAIRATPCPGCGEKALTVTVQLRPKELGTFSLAGQQMKVSAHEVPQLKCTACGISSWEKP